MTKSSKAKSTKSTKRISFVQIANDMNISDKALRAKARRTKNARERFFDETSRRWTCAENEIDDVKAMFTQRANAA